MAKKRKRPRKSGSRSQPPRLEHPLTISGLGGEPTLLELVEFEISFEPLSDPAVDRMPRKRRERLEEIGQQLYDSTYRHDPELDLASFIEELEQFRTEFPDVPLVYNLLAIASRYTKGDRRYKEVLEETHRRFPKYLFGLINLVLTSLQEGKLEEAGRLLDGRYSLHLLYPNRRRFHVSEFMAFNGAVGEYLWRTGKRREATTILEMMEGVDPDHPMARRLRSIIHPGLLGSLLKLLPKKPR